MDWVWIVLAGVIIVASFKAGRQAERDDVIERRKKREQDDLDLGTIAPIAAMMVIGRMTPEQADREVRKSSLLYPSAEQLWKSMSQSEREQLGIDFIKVSAEPEFQARQQKLVDGMKNLDLELWQKAEEAVAKSMQTPG